MGLEVTEVSRRGEVTAQTPVVGNPVAGIIFDDKGRELFDRWMGGTGEALITNGGSWGEYMNANDLLSGQINRALMQDATNRTNSGVIDITLHAEIENGYFTGYELLHGTNADVGNLTIIGAATVLGSGQVVYNVTVTWNDIIDPNPDYLGDTVAAGILSGLYNPADFEVHISWQVSSVQGGN